MPIGSSAGEYFPDESAFLVDQAKKSQAITIRPVQEPLSTTSTMSLGSPTEPAGALKPEGGTNVPEKVPETNLTPEGEHIRFRTASPLVNITDEDIERGINIGMSAGPGTMAGVKSAAIGSKLSDLAHAQILEGTGLPPGKLGSLDEHIYQKTGFWRGAEGKWRYEIDDSKASFDKGWHEDARVSTTGEKSLALPLVLDHPELYKAYPQLQDIRVVRDPIYPSTGAEWASRSKTIRMGTEASENQGILMHEVQHAIQDIEGFVKGGSPGKAGKDYHLRYTRDVEALIPESEAIIRKINTKGLTEEEYARSKYLTTVFKKYQEYKAAGNQQAAKYYLRLAGETEARNVETRLLLTEKERRMFHPEHTADIPAHRQIPVKEAVTTSAYGVMDPKTGMIMKSEPITFKE